MRTLACMLLLAAALPAFGRDVAVRGFTVARVPLGSGTPALGVTRGAERTHHVADEDYHVPNYLPGHPTAATIWPREVALECDIDRESGELRCQGFDLHPALGRGEYLYVRPVVKAIAVPAAPPPCECCPPVRPPAVTRKKPLG